MLAILSASSDTSTVNVRLIRQQHLSLFVPLLLSEATYIGGTKAPRETPGQAFIVSDVL
jgi:hypothetical protein